MSMPHVLVTGGSGFIGSALVKAFLKAGCTVRVLDDNSRGSPRRLADVRDDIEIIDGDIRDAGVVTSAVRGMDEVHHLAYVNGTEYFYKYPELVLDVGVRGMINVIDACRTCDVRTLILASSSEVYQTAKLPTDETAPLIVPDPHNPRFSYGTGKIVSEVMTLQYGQKFFDRVLIFRPHNIYGPDMGFEHAIPQLVLRMKETIARHGGGKRVPFEIQGNGRQTRAFCHVDDLVSGVMIMRAKGEHLGIYHVGTNDEIAIGDLARRIATQAGCEIDLIAGDAPAGGTARRCPDISKLARLGYTPHVSLSAGLPPTVEWYWVNASLASMA
jgi:nucleoside-diphosphate-sugar epimerase